MPLREMGTWDAEALHETPVESLVWQGVDADGTHWRCSSRNVIVGNLAVPEVIELARQPGSTELTMRVEVRAGRPELVAVHVATYSEGREGALTAALRQVDPREVVERAVSRFSLLVERDDDGQVVGFGQDANIADEGNYGINTARQLLRRRAREVDALRAGSGPRSLTPDRLRRVAEVYRASIAGKPTQAVADAFDVSLRSASSYVSRARAAGLLPATTRGRKLA